MSASSTNNTFTPFGRIALSLSGGGFRAAAYSLGAISYLNNLHADQCVLLDHVCHISSTSGGSITNAFYALGRYGNVPFTQTYQTFITKLTSENLLCKVLALLQDDAQWKKEDSKQRNIINAFARVYDEDLFDGKEMGIFFIKENAHKLQVSINATEFYRGLWFRFHNGLNSYKLGNNYVYMKKPTNGVGESSSMRIKVGDVVAASSCFPVGFEPILLPGDFTHKTLSKEELLEDLVVVNYDGVNGSPKDAVGLMDGGITDNQGLRATMDADKTVAGDFDLVIVTDVTSYFMNHYKQPELDETATGNDYTIASLIRKLGKVVKIIGVTAVISCAITLVSLLLILFKPELQHIFIPIACFFFPVVVLSSFFTIKISRLRKKYQLVDACTANDPKALELLLSNNLKEFSTGVLSGIVAFFSGLSIGVIQQMVMSRLMSALSMVLDINLKHTRRLIYDSFYKDEKFDLKRCPNFIYELSAYNNKSRTVRIAKKYTPAQVALLTPNEKMLDIAECARTMGTTL